MVGNHSASDSSNKFSFHSNYSRSQKLKGVCLYPLDYPYQSNSTISPQRFSISSHRILHDYGCLVRNGYVKQALLLEHSVFLNVCHADMDHHRHEHAIFSRFWNGHPLFDSTNSWLFSSFGYWTQDFETWSILCFSLVLLLNGLSEYCLTQRIITRTARFRNVVSTGSSLGLRSLPHYLLYVSWHLF